VIKSIKTFVRKKNKGGVIGLSWQASLLTAEGFVQLVTGGTFLPFTLQSGMQVKLLFLLHP